METIDRIANEIISGIVWATGIAYACLVCVACFKLIIGA